MSEDKRRRQYVPLYVHFMSGNTGLHLHERYGNDGILAWVCFLAAAKRSPVQGTVEWVDDSDGWRLLQFHEPPMGFTFSEFVKSLGALKLTRTEKRGRRKQTTIRAWEQWNNEIVRDHDASYKRRKRAQTTPDIIPPLGRTEGEGEYERTKTSDLTPKTVSQSQWPACPYCGRTEWRDRDDHDNHVSYLCHALDPESAERFQSENGYVDYADIVNAQLAHAEEADL